MSRSIKSLLAPFRQNKDYLDNCLDHMDNDGALGLDFDNEPVRCDESEYIMLAVWIGILAKFKV